MLARHAEHLYWAGRYIERAEDTARLLDVTYHGRLESSGDGAEGWRDLLDSLYLQGEFEDRGLKVNEAEVIRFLVFDRENPGSVVSGVARSRESLRSVRDRIPTELWEAVNTFHHGLRARDSGTEAEGSPYTLFRMIKTHCQTIAGVALEAMSRDEGYAFNLLGRLLERAEMTCRMLQVQWAPHDPGGLPVPFQRWVALLKSVSGFEAYLKRYRAEIQAEQVLEFLLMAPDFPRSVLHCLKASEGRLEMLGAGAPNPPQRIAGRERANLEYREIGEVMEEGPRSFLDGVQQGIRQVGEAVDAHFFRSAGDLELHHYEMV